MTAGVIPLGAAQSAELARIHGLAFPSAAWDEQAFVNLMAGAPCAAWGARSHDARLSAFVLVQVAGAEADIVTVATVPSLRRIGLATRLFQSALHDLAARGVERLALEVAEDNQAARGLYAKLGFEAVGRRKNYYARGRGEAVDALVLSRALAGHFAA